jgi:acyl-CoA synthetase (AMP-forming)/AMP-acid ligase II
MSRERKYVVAEEVAEAGLGTEKAAARAAALQKKAGSLRALKRWGTVKSGIKVYELQNMGYGTLPSRFLHAIDNLPNPRAQMVRREGKWESVSSKEFLRRVAGLSSAFVELGVKPGDRVGLFSTNRPEWHAADFAINGAGAITVPIYFNESPDRMTYILKHCGAKLVFVAGKAQLEKLLAVRGDLPELENVVVASDAGADLPSECLRYETLIAGAGDKDISSYRLRAAQVPPGQLASIIYTSGTTGEPKGVMLTHTNFCSNVTDVGHDFRLNPAEDVALSFTSTSFKDARSPMSRPSRAWRRRFSRSGLRWSRQCRVSSKRLMHGWSNRARRRRA